MLVTSKVAKKFLYIESNQIPLVKIDYKDAKRHLVDPTTGKSYKGIILEGVFADLSNEEANNNNRFYVIDKYLELLGKLRMQIHSPKGVYGELEHPSSYAVNYNNASHKLIDVWYDENTKKVMGQLILLNTEKGLKAQEIIKSGGQLSISARAAGEEDDLPNGHKKATVKLLTTYDIVYHPGFNAAVLNFKELNESEKAWQNKSSSKKGFNLVLYENQLDSIDQKYDQYMSLHESVKPDDCFFEWLAKADMTQINELNEGTSQQKIDAKVLQINEPSDQQDKEDQLHTAAEDDLKEKQKQFFKQVAQSQQKIRKRYNRLDTAYHDNAVGFVTNGIAGVGASGDVPAVTNLSQEDIDELKQWVKDGCK